MARILVVEDDVILRYALAEWLRHESHNVLEAASADEAAIILSSVLDVDIVVTDVNMPGSMNGLDLVRHIRKASSTLPVIVVSGGLHAKAPPAILGASFFQKPYDLQELSTHIATLVPQTDLNDGRAGKASDER